MRKQKKPIALHIILGIFPAMVVFAMIMSACGSAATSTGEIPQTGSTQAATSVPSVAATTGAPASTSAPVSTGSPAATSASAGTSAPVSKGTGPIKIGQLCDLTSTFTPWCLNVRDGMALAAKDINDAGGVNGRQIQIVAQDSQNDGNIGVTRFNQLVQDGVVAVGGIISSGVGVPVAAQAEKVHMPLFLVKSGDQAALTQASQYTFRTCLPAAPMVIEPILQYAQQQKFTKVGAIVADYPWGHAIKAAIEDTFKGSGINVDIEVAPVPPTTDFTPYVRKMANFGAQMIIATGDPPGVAGIVSLSANLAGGVPVTGAWTPPDLTVGGLKDLAIGRFSDFACADYTSADYAKLAQRYLAFSSNKFMSDDAVAGYAIVKIVAQAVGAVGDDPTAIAQYVHSNTFNMPGYAHPLSWTAWGELAASAPIFYQITAGPAPAGLNKAGTWWVKVLSHSAPLTPFKPPQ